MMSPLTGGRIACGNLVSVHMCMFYVQRLLDRVLNHFSESWYSTQFFNVQDGE